MEWVYDQFYSQPPGGNPDILASLKGAVMSFISNVMIQIKSQIKISSLSLQKLEWS